MARKSGFVRRNNRMVRETAWFGGVYLRTVLAGPSTATLITSLNAAALALRPFTIERTRGVIGISSDQIAASESYNAHYARAVVSDQATAIGVTAVPTPSTDSASDLFFVFESIFGALRFNTGVGVYLDDSHTDRTFDSRGKRKVEDGQDVISIVETSAISLGAIVTSFARTLVKLH